MNAYIPDQLDQLSRKDLLEFARTAHGYSVELNAKLAKANERVKELEQENQENLSIIESIANGLSEKPISLCKGVMQGRNPFLNKFAIEKKIEAAKPAFIAGYQYALEPVTSMHSYNQMLEQAERYVEQLRKEQDL